MLLIRMERWVMVKILDRASRTKETFSFYSSSFHSRLGLGFLAGRRSCFNASVRLNS